MSENKFRHMYKHKLYMEREMEYHRNGDPRVRAYRPNYGVFSAVYRIPQLKTYAAWVNHYKNTKPIRGRDEVCRPVGERRYVDTLAFRLGNDGDGAFVGFRMHNVEIMRW